MSRPALSRALLVATDAQLRARLRALMNRRFPNAVITERRDLRDNQTVWDVRSHSYQLLIVQCSAAGQDELEFLASLNRRGLRRSGAIVIADAAELPQIQRLDLGALEFLAREALDEATVIDCIRRVLRENAAKASALPDAGSLLPPELAMNGFQPLRTLSLSNESCVLLVRKAGGDEQFVLKFIPDLDNARMVHRFLQECRIATTQKHKHIVRVHEQGLSSGVAYYVMEYLAGGSLQALRRPLSPAQALRTVLQLATALKHLHGNHIMHLDVKTANVLFRDARTAVLIDFGAARHDLINRNYTLKDHALGTPHYMSPEQATGRPLDQRSDLYALGIVLFELLTGNCPYRSNTVSGVLHRHLREPVPRLPAALGACQPMIDRLLAKQPDERYAHAGELIDALNRLTGSAVASGAR